MNKKIVTVLLSLLKNYRNLRPNLLKILMNHLQEPLINANSLKANSQTIKINLNNSNSNKPNPMVNRRFKFQISQNRLAKFRLRQKISLTAQASWCQPLMSSEATPADYESLRRASISTTRSPLKKVQIAKLLSQGMSRLKHRIRATRQLSLTGQSLRPLTMTNTLMPMAGESKTLKTV